MLIEVIAMKMECGTWSFSCACIPVLFPANIAVPSKPIPAVYGIVHNIFQAPQSTLIKWTLHLLFKVFP